MHAPSADRGVGTRVRPLRTVVTRPMREPVAGECADSQRVRRSTSRVSFARPAPPSSRAPVLPKTRSSCTVMCTAPGSGNSVEALEFLRACNGATRDFLLCRLPCMRASFPERAWRAGFPTRASASLAGWPAGWRITADGDGCVLAVGVGTGWLAVRRGRCV